ncbi:MAG: SRPBCC family protein [Phycisphaerae bacterium]
MATLQGQKRPVATFTRTYDAPRARVFQAWTDPAQLAQWWGPRGFTNPVCHLDVRPGGQIRIDMRAPDGTVFPMAGVFDEVVEPERLVFTCYAHPDAQGVNQLEVRNTVVFTEHEGKTTINVEAVVVKATGDAADAVNGMEAGWMQSLERLAELSACAAPATKPFIISRVFEAPRELVYKVWTEQKHLIRWGGPKGTTVTVGTFDFRPGGMYHTCVRGPEGKEMWGKWAFREIVPLERLVFVTSFSDAAGNLTRHPLSATWPLEMLTTVTFTEAAGRTTVTIQWDPLNATPEERATFAASRDGMQQGWTGMLDTLTEYLATCGA